MSDILLTSKNSNEGIETDTIIDTFKSTDDLELIKQTVSNAKERLYVTWATVDTVDRADEKVPIDEVVGQQDILMERGAPISDEHTNAIHGRTLAYKVMTHPSGKLGVLHLDKIYSHNPEDARIWNEIISGKRTGSSLGGFNMQNAYIYDQEAGKLIRNRKDFYQYETASVTKPCNPLALNEAYSLVAKSVCRVAKSFKDFEVKKKIEITDEIVQQIAEKNEFKGDLGELKQGLLIEQEHSDITHDDIDITAKIALAHLKEVPNYYTKLKEVEKGVNVINKDATEDINKSLEESKMSEEMIKKMDELLKGFSELNTRITKMEEKEKEEEEEVEKKKKVEKEKAALATDADKPQPESPLPENVNQEKVYKSMVEKLDKMETMIAEVQKTAAARPGSLPIDAGMVVPDDIANLPLKVAKGFKAASFTEAHQLNDKVAKYF